MNTTEEPVPRNASVRGRRRGPEPAPDFTTAPASALPLTRLLPLPLPLLLPLVLRDARGGCQAPLKKFRTASCRGVAGGRQAPLPWAPMRTRLSGSARHAKGRNGDEQLEGFEGRVPGSRRSPSGRRPADALSRCPDPARAIRRTSGRDSVSFRSSVSGQRGARCGHGLRSRSRDRPRTEPLRSTKSTETPARPPVRPIASVELGIRATGSGPGDAAR
jgi:hypothetical protein